MALVSASRQSKGIGYVRSLLFLTSSCGTPSVQFIMVIVWRDTAPWTSGINSGTAIVSSAAINEREHTTVTSRGTRATRTYLKYKKEMQ